MIGYGRIPLPRVELKTTRPSITPPNPFENTLTLQKSEGFRAKASRLKL